MTPACCGAWAILGTLVLSCGSHSERKASLSGEPVAATGSQAEASQARVVFRGKDGRTITDQDLQTVSGDVNWELGTGKPVPAEATALHEQGRRAGADGRYDEALELFADAARLAPDWPYPPYDAAFTCLLKQEDQRALEFYKQTLMLAPRGFFTAITAVHYLEQEAARNLPRGTYLAFLSLEWMDSSEERARRIEAFTVQIPTFAPAWEKLALLREDDGQALTALETGLAQAPDAETRGFLLLNKALLLDRSGRHDDAVTILGTLATDPAEPMDVGQLARSMMAKIVLTSR